MEKRLFHILAENKTSVINQIAKLNKRARKLSLPEITVTLGRVYPEIRTINGIKKEVLILPAEITGPLDIKYNNWQFIATLQHLSTGANIIRLCSNFSIPVKYYNCDSNCEHCNVKRNRNDTYLVRNDSGLIMQVGSSCIKDFLGGNSPDWILQHASLIADLFYCLNNTNGKLDQIFYIETVLSQTLSCIRQYGWVSKTVAEEQNMQSTASFVYNNLYPPSLDYNICQITDDDKLKAQQVIAWVENLSDEQCIENIYLHNIRAIVNSGAVDFRNLGYAVSIIPAFERTNEKKNKSISNYVGEIKSRQQFNLIVKKIFCNNSSYGAYFKYIFEDEDNNIMVWSTSKKQDLNINQKIQLLGTIKNHTFWKNVKQTEITRCKIQFYLE
jgi:hypothetical protein